MQVVDAAGDADIQRLQAELQRVSAAAAQREEAARQQVASIRGEAEQRQMQLAVIMDTLEALQSGSDGAHGVSSLTLLFLSQAILTSQARQHSHHSILLVNIPVLPEGPIIKQVLTTVRAHVQVLWSRGW